MLYAVESRYLSEVLVTFRITINFTKDERR